MAAVVRDRYVTEYEPELPDDHPTVVQGLEEMLMKARHSSSTSQSIGMVVWVEGTRQTFMGGRASGGQRHAPENGLEKSPDFRPKCAWSSGG